MSDELALGAHAALGEAGRAAAISGWDASPDALAPQIFTVTNPLREQGRLCARAALHPEAPAEHAVDWHVVDPSATATGR